MLGSLEVAPPMLGVSYKMRPDPPPVRADRHDPSIGGDPRVGPAAEEPTVTCESVRILLTGLESQVKRFEHTGGAHGDMRKGRPSQVF